MNYSKYNKYTPAELKNLYLALLKPRLIEEKMLKLLRQGQISKWFSGIGQEAIAVGVTSAIDDDEYIMPLHRNLGVFTTRGIPYTKLLKQWQGSADGFTKGRDRSFHFGTKQYHIAGMISHLGAMLSVADGVALANRIDKNKKITVAFSGDGGTSEGEFHEALNLAAVWDLPVLFVVENNGYGLSTPTSDQLRCEHIADKGIGYGIESLTIDGNNILEVHATVKKIAAKMRRRPRPFLLECKTFRRRGHEEASGVKYVPKDLMEEWEKKDPIENFESYLVRKKVLSKTDLASIKAEMVAQINEDAKILAEEDAISVSTEYELNDVFHPHPFFKEEANSALSEMRFIDAIQDGLGLAMEKYTDLILMGQDIAEYGGVFKITDGFLDKFGKDRVRNTPISEAAPLGAALGLSIMGKKSMVEMQFSDFVSCGFNQIVNNLAKTYYRWGQNADVVIRMPTGGGVAAGPFHSQSTEGWFFKTPGLKIVYPSSPNDAKGLLLAAFDDPNPVLFFEHKNLYRSIKEDVPTGEYTIEIGQANFISRGSDITLISYGWAVHWCKELTEELGIDATILDLRSLSPWDKVSVREAVEDTGKVIVVQEDSLGGGIASEIASWIGEHCFTALDAPVARIGSLPTPIPFNADLEKNYLGKDRLKGKISELLEW